MPAPAGKPRRQQPRPWDSAGPRRMHCHRPLTSPTSAPAPHCRMRYARGLACALGAILTVTVSAVAAHVATPHMDAAIRGTSLALTAACALGSLVTAGICTPRAIASAKRTAAPAADKAKQLLKSCSAQLRRSFTRRANDLGAAADDAAEAAMPTPAAFERLASWVYSRSSSAGSDVRALLLETAPSTSDGGRSSATASRRASASVSAPTSATTSRRASASDSAPSSTNTSRRASASDDGTVLVASSSSASSSDDGTVLVASSTPITSRVASLSPTAGIGRAASMSRAASASTSASSSARSSDSDSWPCMGKKLLAPAPTMEIGAFWPEDSEISGSE